MIIKKESWNKCKYCNQSLDQIVKEFGGGGVYKTQCFKKHLKNYHNVEINQYFANPPKCKCGICKQDVKIKSKPSSNFHWREYACGRNEGVKQWSKKAKTERLKDGNPMYQKKPWNKGLTKNNSKSLSQVSKKLINRRVSKKTKKRQSESAKKRTIHGHTGCKHNENSKQRMREATLKRIKNGSFPQTNTLPAKKFKSILERLNIRHEEEKIVDVWSFDFYLIDNDVYIEVDGDYFHSNPMLYPDGPTTKTQKINYYRDEKKNTFCKNNNIELIRFWESDILGEKQCVLQKLYQLKK